MVGIVLHLNNQHYLWHNRMNFSIFMIFFILLVFAIYLQQCLIHYYFSIFDDSFYSIRTLFVGFDLMGTALYPRNMVRAHFLSILFLLAIPKLIIRIRLCCF